MMEFSSKIRSFASFGLMVFGFVLMLLSGAFGIWFFAGGALAFFYGFGMGLLMRLDGNDFLAETLLILLLINLAFYSSAELFWILDVSFLIYGILLASLLLIVWLRAGMAKNNLRSSNPWIFGLFLASVIASGFLAVHRKEAAYFFVINIAAFSLYFSILNLKLSYAQIRRILSAMVGLGALSSLMALWQLYSPSFKTVFFPFFAPRDRQILELWEYVSRVVGTWQHPSYLGIFLAICIPVGVHLMFFCGYNFRWQAVWFGSLTLNSSVLLLTNTRSSVIAGFLGVVLFYFFRHRRKASFPNNPISVKRFAVMGSAVVVAMLLYQFVYVTEIYRKPQAWRVDASATIWGRFLRSDSMSTESLVQRSELYDLARRTFYKHPLVGIGAKNFQYVVAEKFGQGTDAHNIFFQTAAEMGLLGIVAIIWLYGWLLWTRLKLLYSSRSRSQQDMSALLAALVFLIMFDSIFNNPLYSLRVLALFWIFAGLQYASSKLTSNA